MDWDTLGNALDEISGTPDRAPRLDAYRELLADLSPGDEGWAEVQMCLADDLLTDGHVDDARTAYQLALEDGGRTVLAPETGLLVVALTEGDSAQVDELLALLLTRSRAEGLVVGDYAWIGESLEESGRLRAALRWFTIPLRDIQPGDIDLMPIVCLTGRWRVRRALDLPVDAYDEAYDVWHEVDAAAP
ncbi:hypothetical protein C6I20_08095 [Aeromicrobium sp. A1-2]|uniref:hypothetical protein n=1 Tax=Aeromicrobium sp. A1-2 TaxID=2107713 RepID=UPI000E4D4537|nr:hypothetical protein [Aeromicrobium sp. A1-2]AXT85148.1 hypothetical protein C6I20_08095 [Aeromicrobium sp. A1-2]